MTVTETDQRTLSGDEADRSRTRPLTLIFCHDCGEWVLRRTVRRHGLSPTPRWDNEFVFTSSREARADD